MNHNPNRNTVYSTVDSAFTPSVFHLRSVPFPYFYLNPSGAILFANQDAVKLVGKSLTEMVNQALDNLLSVPIQNRLLSLANQTNTEGLDILLNLANSSRLLNLRAKIMVDTSPGSNIRGFHLFVVDTCSAEDSISPDTAKQELENYQSLLAYVKTQTEFLQDFLHDLKTPLSTLSTALYLIKNSENANYSRQLHIMSMEVQHLKEMILAASDYHHIAQFDSSLNGQVWSIGDIIHHASTAFADRFEAKGIEFRTKPCIRDGHVMGDRTRLLQVFANIFENAYRYTEAGTVLVNVHQDYERSLVFIIVQDSGIGIPYEELPKIFDRFYRAANAKAHNPIGSGLGLNIVRQIIEQHNGEIEIFSRQDVGTTVVVTLPLVL